MLDWIFGSKKEEKKEVKQDELGKDEKWVYDYVKQYLTSPIWRNPLLDFIEENCIIFEDIEENKFEYTKIFQEFTGLSALLLETMIEEIGITEKTLEKCIIKGLKSEKDNKIFRQILLCDNFLAFKKIMVAKNKELQVEALKEIHPQVHKGSQKAHQKHIEISELELERLQIEKAIAMSLAVSEKAVSQEEKQLQEAIRLSQMEYQQQQKKRVQEVAKEKPAEKKASLLGPLPPLVLGTVKANRPIQQFQKEQTKLKSEIEDLKQKEEERRAKEQKEQENTEQRKKRLLEQRELIRKKKQDERKEELSTFVSNKQPAGEQKISEQEMQRRRNLMKKLKEQLKE